MRIKLNLATRPFADLGPAIKRLRIAMASLVVLAIALGLGVRAIDKKAEEARAREHSLDGQIAHINQERQGYQKLMQQPDNAQLLKQAAALNKLFDLKAFSWTLAMEDLETVLPGGVQVSTLEPIRDDKAQKITLHLRVIGPRDRAVELVRNLEHSKRFVLPRITGENSDTSNAPGERLEPVSASNKVNFDVQADYNSTAPVEHKAGKKEKPEGEASKSPAKSHAAPGKHGAGTPAAPTVQPMGRPPYTGQPPVRPSPRQFPTPGGPQ